MRTLILAALVFIAMQCVSVVRGEGSAIDLDADGRVRAVLDWPREVNIHAELWVVGQDWKTIVQQQAFANANRTPKLGVDADGGFIRTGDATIDGRHIAVNETATPSRVAYRCVAGAEAVPLTGIYWFASVPIDRFVGGSVEVGEQKITLTKATSPDTRALGNAKGDGLILRTADGHIAIECKLDAPRTIRVQDASAYGEPAFQIFIPLAEGDLARAQPATLAIDFKTTIAPDATDVHITIDPAKPLADFDGFGGNFVYGIDSPVTRVALDSLKLTWARVPLELREWEPINDNGDATLTNAAVLAAHDVEGSKLRKRFELDRELFKRTDGRLIASIWYLPEWLFAEPVTNNWRERAGTVPRERWEELAECITSYLLRLRDAYGVEPRLLSFNESDQGVYVKLDGQSMRDLTKLLAVRFERAGLKTKLLLGDSAGVAAGLKQIAPTLADAQARAFVGGLAYHPWAGENESWPAWAELAQKFALPLFTTELGADSDAWRDGSFNSPQYTLRLATRYLEQLSTSHSRALFEWEWSDDFPIAVADVSGPPKLTPRGQWLKQLTQTTPQFGKTVQTQCDRATVRAATIARGNDWTVHIANLDAARRVSVTGLPVAITSMTLHIVEPLTGTLPDRAVRVVDGELSVDLPTAALATLSTVQPPR